MPADQQPERRKLRLITEPAREAQRAGAPQSLLREPAPGNPASSSATGVAQERRLGGGSAGDTPEPSSAFGYPVEDAYPEGEFEIDQAEEAEVRSTGTETEGRSLGRLWPTVAAVLALSAFGGVVWYAYNGDSGAVQTAELPIVRAAPGPIKSKPEDPGGLDVPYQDQLVLNEMTPDPDRPQVERLLPPPETPLPPAALVAPPPAPAVPSLPEAETVISEAGPAETEAGSTPAEPEAAPQSAAAPAVESAPAAQPAPAPAAPAESRSAAPTPDKAPATGDFVIQLASLKQRAGADVEWARLQKAFPELLGTKRLQVQEVDLGSRGIFYRVQAGFFADRSGAEALCAQLKARRQDCLVSRR